MSNFYRIKEVVNKTIKDILKTHYINYFNALIKKINKLSCQKKCQQGKENQKKIWNSYLISIIDGDPF